VTTSDMLHHSCNKCRHDQLQFVFICVKHSGLLLPYTFKHCRTM
jgi:hypothetical protein